DNIGDVTKPLPPEQVHGVSSSNDSVVRCQNLDGLDARRWDQCAEFLDMTIRRRNRPARGCATFFSNEQCGEAIPKRGAKRAWADDCPRVKSPAGHQQAP